MDGNKDESDRCFNLAKRALAGGDEEKAIRLLHKAQRLYPSRKAEELLKKMTDRKKGKPESKPGTTEETETQDYVRKRRASGADDAQASTTSENNENRTTEYTTEQLTAVERVLKCKDYYEVLEVGKECTENDLKKAYRKLALLMHPDKNKAPGATEAFKAIGNAYSVLNNPDKRKKYDENGPDIQQSSPEADIPPEELFNRFFGGGYPSGSVNQWQRVHVSSRCSNLLLPLLGASPLLCFVIFSLISGLFVGDPIYNLQRTEKYSVPRNTYRLRVPYYVKEDFKIDGDSLKELRGMERRVEEEYKSQLRRKCWQEQNERETIIRDARSYKEATKIKTPSCDRFHSLYP